MSYFLTIGSSKKAHYITKPTSEHWNLLDSPNLKNQCGLAIRI